MCEEEEERDRLRENLSDRKNKSVDNEMHMQENVLSGGAVCVCVCRSVLSI